MSQDPIQCLLAQAYQPARCEGGLSCVPSEVHEVISPRTSSGEDPILSVKGTSFVRILQLLFSSFFFVSPSLSDCGLLHFCQAERKHVK